MVREITDETLSGEAGASPAAAGTGAGTAHRPAPPPPPFSQLEEFLAFLEYIIDSPPGPYRPARLARALKLSETRVRRWLLLLAARGWLRRVHCDYFQAERFDAWGRAYVGQIINNRNGGIK